MYVADLLFGLALVVGTYAEGMETLRRANGVLAATPRCALYVVRSKHPMRSPGCVAFSFLWTGFTSLLRVLARH